MFTSNKEKQGHYYYRFEKSLDFKVKTLKCNDNFVGAVLDSKLEKETIIKLRERGYIVNIRNFLQDKMGDIQKVTIEEVVSKSYTEYQMQFIS